jgi:amidase
VGSGNHGVDIWSSATEQSRLLRQRAISASELLAIYRERIERFNPRLNAIVVQCFERAEERAREIDSMSPQKIPEPLGGLPMTVKESLEVAGLQTTGGLISVKGRVSEVNSPHVEALLKSGMVLMGKTNIPSECADWQSNSPVYGRTNNPWNLERSPGGSSGGSAAAVASGMTPLEIGTDISGSVRVPANYCGLYGLRPSETAVPRWGDYPGSSMPNPAVPMSVFGPLARFAEDLELALDIISMPDPGEDAGWRCSVRYRGPHQQFHTDPHRPESPAALEPRSSSQSSKQYGPIPEHGIRSGERVLGSLHVGHDGHGP